MWRFKPFMSKESASLEGRAIDVSNVKVQIRNAIAEGGFSCVYLARDLINSSKQYALKQMICNDAESMELAMKEISVMKHLKGHPNIVTLVAHTILDMGRTKEVLLLMEFCEKSLVSVLENRGAGYFEENQILLIFRDVCNAVFAMHCQSPPIAHRDLKAENVLLGSDGVWKLCDFGSTSTNHKCFDRPEEMGIEEDTIRKHTTPAYRAPEMWDLFRKEVISEKVDIWALGCLLYRICYFKSAFDGESKLQILNGNYRIPDLPKYSTSMTGLIKDMLGNSPDARPDITQVWFRVNEQLPVELQKHLPDSYVSSADIHPPTSDSQDEGVPKRSPVMPRRSPPPPPSKEQARNISPNSGKDLQHSRPSQSTSKTTGAPIGAFWSTQHAQDSQAVDDKGPVFDKEPTNPVGSKQNWSSQDGEQRVQPGDPLSRSARGNPAKKYGDGLTKDFEINFFPDSSERSSERTKAPHSDSKTAFPNEAFNTFVAEFDTNKFSPGITGNNKTVNGSWKEDLEAEVDRLKEQLKQSNLEKAEITSKYEKLSAICRSQRQEIHELKRALAAANPCPPNKDSSKSEISPGSVQPSALQGEKIEGTVWELQQGMFAGNSTSTNPDSKPWQAFAEEPTPTSSHHPRSVRTVSSHQNTPKQSTTTTAAVGDAWGFDQESFIAAPGGPQISRASGQGSSSQRFSITGERSRVDTSQPSGWAGF